MSLPSGQNMIYVLQSLCGFKNRKKWNKGVSKNYCSVVIFLAFEEGCRDFMQMQLGNVEKRMACKAR